VSRIHFERLLIREQNKVSKLPNNNYKKTYVKHEVDALIRLNENYKCICGKGFHFPRIVHIFKNHIEITNCGESLQRTKKKIQDIHSHEKQLNCIFGNLVRSKIMHLDIIPKNICVNEKNVISIIDFDMLHFLENEDFKSIGSVKMQKYWIENNRKLMARCLIQEIRYNAKYNLKQERWRKAFFRLMYEANH
jgi:RIO-like serine/threonine protein kinase